MFAEVPIVDPERDPAGVVTALVRYSCVLVTGAAVPVTERDEALDAACHFFELPLEERRRVCWSGEGHWRGWQPMGSDGAVNITAAPALAERYEFQVAGGGAWSLSDVTAGADRFPLWPERPPGFRDAWVAYYAAAARLAGRLVDAVADSLDLPADAVTDWRERQYANLVVNNYLQQEQIPEQGLRQRPHTDIGGLTLLWGDDAPGGLEVRMPGVPGWSPVRFPPECILVQAGDLLARWTNSVIRANVHRVANPPAGAAANRRMSIVYFHFPRLDLVVEPAPSCVAGGRPAGAPIHAGAHFLNAIRRPVERYATHEAPRV